MYTDINSEIIYLILPFAVSLTFCIFRPCMSFWKHRSVCSSMSPSHHNSNLRGGNVFLLRQLLIVIPADESGQITAVLWQGPCWKRLERRQGGEPGERDSGIWA